MSNVLSKTAFIVTAFSVAARKDSQEIRFRPLKSVLFPLTDDYVIKVAWIHVRGKIGAIFFWLSCIWLDLIRKENFQSEEKNRKNFILVSDVNCQWQIILDNVQCSMILQGVFLQRVKIRWFYTGFSYKDKREVRFSHYCVTFYQAKDLIALSIVA